MDRSEKKGGAHARVRALYALCVPSRPLRSPVRELQGAPDQKSVSFTDRSIYPARSSTLRDIYHRHCFALIPCAPFCEYPTPFLSSRRNIPGARFPGRLDRELSCQGSVERFLVLGQLLRHLSVAVVLDNLGAVANEQLGVYQAVNFVPDGLRYRVSFAVHRFTCLLTRELTLKNSAFLTRSRRSLRPPCCLTTSLAW